MNPLSNLLGGGNSNAMGGNPMQMIGQFMQFANNFQGDPKQKLDEMVKSGQVTQDQVNSAMQTAQSLLPMIQKFMK